ncbi:ADP-ribosylation factor family-domain-containing protein [Mycena galopus ATCC 62051]|nr:ADP-ribosylation factor family-domain-containing protein [Mycena galopus ATCC 62051]
MGSVISTVALNSAALLGLPKTFTLVLIGLDDAGKTSLVNRLSRRELPLGVLPATISTIGSTLETIPHGRHSVTVWEFGGSEKFRPLWRRYLWNGHAFVFLLDATAPARFPEAKDELIRLWEGTSDKHPVLGESKPVLVLANNVDLADAAELSMIEEALGVPELAHSDRKIALKGMSAMTGEGIDEALEWFVANLSHQFIAEINEEKRHATQAW